VVDLVALGRVANATTRAALDLCADRPGESVSLTEIVEAAGVVRPVARGQLAGLTMVIKHRFHRGNWPFSTDWAADGTQQAFYKMSVDAAERWRQAMRQLDVELSDASEEAAPDLPSADGAARPAVDAAGSQGEA